MSRDERPIPAGFGVLSIEETMMTTSSNHPEPRWPAMLALLAVGGLRLALPEPLSVGPAWLLILIVGALIIPTVLARLRGDDRLNQILGYLLTSIVTLDMLWSLGLLLRALPSHKETPIELLISAAACGSRTFSSSHRGTGVWMREGLVHANYAEFIPTELFCFRK